MFLARGCVTKCGLLGGPDGAALHSLPAGVTICGLGLYLKDSSLLNPPGKLLLYFQLVVFKSNAF